MKERTVVIEIDEQGNSSVNLEGFRGKGCADVAKDFWGGDSVRTAQHKREFYLDSIATILKHERQ